MDASRFDRLIALVSASGARRGLLRRLAALPLSGMLAAFVTDASEAGWNAQHAEITNQRKKGKRKRKKKCKRSIAKNCANKCGLFKNKCKKTFDCGPCPICQTCNTAAGECAIAANRSNCGGSDICCNGVCCDGCCGSDGSCGPCLAFTTSTTHNGDLGGLSGADEICQNLADNAPTPLPGSYRAWLSIGTGANESPSTRFRQSGQGYKRVDGVTVANSWDDLTDGSIDNPIFAMEDGSPVPPPSGNVLIWTNTRPDGTEISDEPRDCDNWTSPDQDQTGRLGMSDPIVTDPNWTELGSVQFCDAANVRLYCFQQD